MGGGGEVAGLALGSGQHVVGDRSDERLGERILPALSESLSARTVRTSLRTSEGRISSSSRGSSSLTASIAWRGRTRRARRTPSRRGARLARARRRARRSRQSGREGSRACRSPRRGEAPRRRSSRVSRCREGFTDLDHVEGYPFDALDDTGGGASGRSTTARRGARRSARRKGGRVKGRQIPAAEREAPLVCSFGSRQHEQEDDVVGGPVERVVGMSTLPSPPTAGPRGPSRPAGARRGARRTTPPFERLPRTQDCKVKSRAVARAREDELPIGNIRVPALQARGEPLRR